MKVDSLADAPGESGAVIADIATTVPRARSFPFRVCDLPRGTLGRFHTLI
jgi:hypothetical protein